MPNPLKPIIQDWVTHLKNIVGKIDENTYFVGHSIGCQTIMRYLESLPENIKIGGIIFVAGWFTLMNLKTKEEEIIAKPWLETPIITEKIKKQTRNIVAIFSDNDEFVPIENKKLFEKRLGAKTMIEHNKGHFSGGDGVKEISSVLDSLLSFK